MSWRPLRPPTGCISVPEDGRATSWISASGAARTPRTSRARSTDSILRAIRSSPCVALIVDVRDEDGRPTMASFIFRDARGRVYPAPSRRLAPDLFFHPQVYRQSGESVLL